QQARASTIAIGPITLAYGIFNPEGRADVALSSYQSATSTGKYLSVALGNGGGTFQPPKTFAAGVESFAVTAGDFNADGVPDLAIANSFSTTVSILLGKGDGTFPAAASYATGRDPESVVVADFNRDGKLDV